MIRFFIPVIFLGLAAAIFFYGTDPVLTEIDGLKIKKAELADGIAGALKLQERQDVLRDTYNALDESQLKWLDKLLPDNIDNVRLIIDINNIAKFHGITIKNVSIANAETKPGETTTGENLIKNDSVVLNFSVSASYEVFKLFLKDLADSLRLVDVTSLSFAANDKNLYAFSVGLKTYWLK